MSNKILVTDSLFIFDEHVKQLEAAGYEVERLDKPDATEEELCEAVKGKVGYILGGIEKVTPKVFDAADKLKALVFTGADYEFFVPGWKHAKDLDIAVANAPGSNQYAVSEFAVGVAIAMQRNLFELGKTGNKTFETTGSIKDSTIGIVGAGRIGSRIIDLIRPFEPAEILYNSRTEKEVNASYKNLENLVAKSDIIFIGVPASAGKLFNAQIIQKIKKNALIVCISSTDLFDLEALLKRLKDKSLRMAIDYPAPNEEFANLPLGTWFNTNDHTAYNTHQANQVASDMAVETLLSLLKDGKHPNRVA